LDIAFLKISRRFRRTVELGSDSGRQQGKRDNGETCGDKEGADGEKCAMIRESVEEAEIALEIDFRAQRQAHDPNAEQSQANDERAIFESEHKVPLTMKPANRLILYQILPERV
jgi:hypothetical protein